MNKLIKKVCFLFFSVSLCLLSCKTTDFSNLGYDASADQKKYKNLEEESNENYNEMQEYLAQERLKEVDVTKTVVYVEKPVYYPVESPGATDKPVQSGKEAARLSTAASMQKPSKYSSGTMYYDFDADFTYEIYCQPYRVTDLILEPGEQVIEMPFLSEEKVWEIGAGVSKTNGYDTQHFFLKPSYSGLETSFIVITDRRVYHILLKSFRDCYMSQVKWIYPNTMPFNLKSQSIENSINKMSKEMTGVDPRYLSFDYIMKYSAYKKPYWLPTRVYDDGRRTYIVLNETVLHMATPVLFNKRNERINYSVDKNIIILNELIEKVTLRVGRTKVVIQKKKYKESRNKVVVQEKEENIVLEDRNPMLHSTDMYRETKILEEKKKSEQEAMRKTYETQATDN